MLQHALKTIADGPRSIPQNPISFGALTIDAAFGGGLNRGGVHEIYAPSTAHHGAATGFTAALVVRAAGNRPILWVRQEFLDPETGGLNASGLAGLGLDPHRIVLVRTRDTEGALRAGEQAARCTALGAVVIETWGMPKILDFTVSRRLSLAAAKSGVPILLLRASASPSHSAAMTRWSVKACPSRALEGHAPGLPVFELTLLRHRGGTAGDRWCVEWNRDQQCFQDQQRTSATPLPRPMVAISAGRPAEARVPVQKFRTAG